MTCPFCLSHATLRRARRRSTSAGKNVSSVHRRARLAETMPNGAAGSYCAGDVSTKRYGNANT
jgi:hypothetical protein